MAAAHKSKEQNKLAEQAARLQRELNTLLAENERLNAGTAARAAEAKANGFQ